MPWRTPAALRATPAGGSGFPDYTTETKRRRGRPGGPVHRSIFGHIVPDYPRLLRQGAARHHGGGARRSARSAQVAEETAFLDSVQIIACKRVIDYAARLAERCEQEADACPLRRAAAELRQMAANLRQSPAGPAQTFWQALQSVWLLHMIFHATMNGNAMGRLDQYVWPYLRADLEAGRLDLERAAELVDCFCLKFNERAKTTDEQRPRRASRSSRTSPAARATTRPPSSAPTATRLDATNHWLQNIIVGGLTPDGRGRHQSR